MKILSTITLFLLFLGQSLVAQTIWENSKGRPNNSVEAQGVASSDDRYYGYGTVGTGANGHHIGQIGVFDTEGGLLEVRTYEPDEDRSMVDLSTAVRSGNDGADTLLSLTVTGRMSDLGGIQPYRLRYYRDQAGQVTSSLVGDIEYNGLVSVDVSATVALPGGDLIAVVIVRPLTPDTGETERTEIYRLNGSGEPVWQRQFNHIGESFSQNETSLKRTPTGELLLAGALGRRSVVLLLDPETGESINEYIFPEEEFAFLLLRGVEALSNGKFVVSGFADRFDPNTGFSEGFGAYVVVFSADLEPLAENELNNSFAIGHDVQEVENGNFAVAINQNDRPVLQRYNQQANLLGTTSYAGRLGNSSLESNLQITEDLRVLDYRSVGYTDGLVAGAFLLSEEAQDRTEYLTGGTVGHREVIYAAALHPEGYLLAGSQYNEGSGEDTWMLIVDHAGNIVREQASNDPKSEFPVLLRRDREGNYLLVGTRATENFGFRPFLRKLRPDLTVLWETSYDGSAFISWTSTDLTLRNDGSYLLVQGGRVFVFRADGSLVGETEFGEPFTFPDVIGLRDGGFVTVGETFDDNNLVSGEEFIVYDDNGTQLSYSKVTTEVLETFGLNAFRVAGGVASARSLFNGGMRILWYDYEGNLLRTTEHEGTQFGFSFFGTQSYGEEGFLNAVDTRYYDQLGNAVPVAGPFFQRRIPVSRSTALTFGATFRNNSLDAYWSLRALDAPTLPLVVPTTESLLVAPNPNQGVFRFRYQGPQFESYRVTDASGRVWKSGSFPFRDGPSSVTGHTYSVFAPELPTGTYFLTVIGDGEVYSERFLVL